MPFAFAGLWERWIDRSEGNEVRSFTIVTMNANPLTEGIHNRMPCILKEENEEKWLDMSVPPAEAVKLLQEYPSEKMKFYEVSTLVNKPENNVPEVVKEVRSKK
jgi:putative SOS response-associated peptidase YedK